MNREPDLSAERTQLAWRRTTLALAVVAILDVRLAVTRGVVGELVAIAALAGLLAVARLTTPRMRGAALREPDDGGPRILAVSAAATAGYAALGMALILAG